MIVAFFESIKYVGHLFPIAFLRIYMGYVFLDSALNRIQGDFLSQPRLAAAINESLPQISAPIWYTELLENFVVPNWQIFAYTITYFEFIIGISFLVGFLVRPAALLGVLLSLSLVYGSAGDFAALNQSYLTIFLILAWLGAGRCLGFDYFFFKRRRGIWW